MPNGRLPDLVVNAEGFRPWRQSLFPVTGDIEIGLEPSARLTVRVVAADGGAPVPFVPVKATYRNLPDVNASETLLTDRHGRVVFSRISGDTVRLDVRGHGYVIDDRIQPEEHRCFTLAPGEEREVLLRVTRSVVLMGRVTTVAGDPVQGGWVGYKTSGISGNKSLGQGHEFILEDLIPGDFWLRASRRGLRGDVITGTLAPGEVRTMELELGAGAWFLAEVKGADTGRPLAGARVDLSRCGIRPTDSAGQVRFGPFDPEEKIVEVWCKGYCPFRQRVLCVVGQTTSLNVTLSRGMSLAGKVLLGNSTPAIGARIRLSGNGLSLYRYRTTTGEDGSFLLRGLPSCRVTVSASLRDADGGLHQGHQVLATGTTDAIIGLARTEEVTYRRVRLKVRDGEGALVPKAEFEVLKESPTDDEFGHDSGWVVNGVGDFEMDPEATSFRLYVYGARRPSDVPLPLGDGVFGPWPAGAECVEVVLPEGRVIAGKVMGSGGQGVPGVEVFGSRASWPGREPSYRFPWHARTGAGGSFAIEGLGAGMVTLEVEVPEGMVQVAPAVVRAGEKGVVIRLDSLVSVVVTVRDQEGRPLQDAYAGVWNLARFEGEGENATVVDSERSDDAGRLRLADLPAAARHVLIVTPYGTSDLAPMRIDGWVPRDTEIILPPGLCISGRILHQDGTPVRGDEGYFWSWGRAKGWDPVVIQSDGKFRERCFSEGRVALIWIPPGPGADVDLIKEPESYDWSITWVRAGAEDILIRLPSR